MAEVNIRIKAEDVRQATAAISEVTDTLKLLSQVGSDSAAVMAEQLNVALSEAKKEAAEVPKSLNEYNRAVRQTAEATSLWGKAQAFVSESWHRLMLAKDIGETIVELHDLSKALRSIGAEPAAKAMEHMSTKMRHVSEEFKEGGLSSRKFADDARDVVEVLDHVASELDQFDLLNNFADELYKSSLNARSLHDILGQFGVLARFGDEALDAYRAILLMGRQSETLTELLRRVKVALDELAEEPEFVDPSFFAELNNNVQGSATLLGRMAQTLHDLYKKTATEADQEVLEELTEGLQQAMEGLFAAFSDPQNYAQELDRNLGIIRNSLEGLADQAARDAPEAFGKMGDSLEELLASSRGMISDYADATSALRGFINTVDYTEQPLDEIIKRFRSLSNEVLRFADETVAIPAGEFQASLLDMGTELGLISEILEQNADQLNVNQGQWSAFLNDLLAGFPHIGAEADELSSSFANLHKILDDITTRGAVGMIADDVVLRAAEAKGTVTSLASSVADLVGVMDAAAGSEILEEEAFSHANYILAGLSTNLESFVDKFSEIPKLEAAFVGVVAALALLQTEALDADLAIEEFADHLEELLGELGSIHEMLEEFPVLEHFGDEAERAGRHIRDAGESIASATIDLEDMHKVLEATAEAQALPAGAVDTLRKAQEAIIESLREMVRHLEKAEVTLRGTSYDMVATQLERLMTMMDEFQWKIQREGIRSITGLQQALAAVNERLQDLYNMLGKFPRLGHFAEEMASTGYHTVALQEEMEHLTHELGNLSRELHPDELEAFAQNLASLAVQMQAAGIESDELYGQLNELQEAIKELAAVETELVDVRDDLSNVTEKSRNVAARWAISLAGGLAIELAAEHVLKRLWRRFKELSPAISAFAKRIFEAAVAFGIINKRTLTLLAGLSAMWAKLGAAGAAVVAFGAKIKAAISGFIALGIGVGKAMTSVSKWQSAITGATATAAGFASTVMRLGTIALGLAFVVAVEKAIFSIYKWIDAAARAGGQAAITMQAVNNLAESMGMLGADVMEDLRKATLQTVDNFKLSKSAAFALSVGVGQSSRELAELARIGTIMGLAMGMDASEGFETLATAIARASVPLFKQVGLLVDIEVAHEHYAEQLGKSVEALTEEEKVRARTLAALELGRKKVEQVGIDTENYAIVAAQAQAATENLRIAFTRGAASSAHFADLKKKLTGLIRDLSNAMADLEPVVTAVVDVFSIGIKTLLGFRQELDFSAESIAAIKAQHESWAAAIEASHVPGAGLVADLVRARAAFLDLKKGIDEAEKGIDDFVKGLFEGQTFLAGFLLAFGFGKEAAEVMKEVKKQTDDATGSWDGYRRVLEEVVGPANEFEKAVRLADTSTNALNATLQGMGAAPLPADLLVGLKEQIEMMPAPELPFWIDLLPERIKQRVSESWKRMSEADLREMLSGPLSEIREFELAEIFGPEGAPTIQAPEIDTTVFKSSVDELQVIIDSLDDRLIESMDSTDRRIKQTLGTEAVAQISLMTQAFRDGLIPTIWGLNAAIATFDWTGVFSPEALQTLAEEIHAAGDAMLEATEIAVKYGVSLDFARAALAALHGRYEEFTETQTKAADNAKHASLIIQTALVDGISGVAESMGMALAGLAEGWDEFGKRMIGVLANMAVNLGKLLIAMGVAGAAIQTFMTNPVTAIIAGAALVALGSALKAAAGATVAAGGRALAGGGAGYGGAARIPTGPGALEGGRNVTIQIVARDLDRAGAMRILDEINVAGALDRPIRIDSQLINVGSNRGR